ncbi:MAG: galactan 5-O-arabinofuranosyltransferase [Corynebacterium sp.]|uniref:galactan 5-O-arabinofuranosyltransferase n=1 Tax=Corynebacterium sp. TaxID=1720 RepID=UPI0026DC57C0|nr:galactan 5-O-arabinofuranosyltransferase [Corynebacterium sp.]MDO4761869.1 galactan 5-O-arabinofuranosyltransferase [Corynebacterium sp.]
MTVQEDTSLGMAQPADCAHPTAYAPDVLSTKKTLLSIVAAGIGGAIFTFLCWVLLKTTNLPAFGPSNVMRALSTFGSAVVIGLTSALMIAWVMDEKNARAHPRWRRMLTYLVAYLSPAGLVVSTIGIPLSATRLYLDGITVDQGFRTQFMTRLTDSWHLSDMNYIDMPTFYPGMWFWFGGRFGNILGMPGWEVFQPWSLVSIAAAACILVPVWQRILGSLPVATAIALVTTCIILVTSAEEPYAAIIALGVPAASILIQRALLGAPLAMTGVILYLGFSASAYTLYTGVVALSAIVVAAIFSGIVYKSMRPLFKLLIMGTGSMAVAAIWWLPYLWALLSGRPSERATAQHYLPMSGTQFPLPMLAPSVIGVLCLIGLIFLIARSSNPDIRMMGVSLAVFYFWAALSMAITIAGTTLLGFRLDSVIAVQLATAGVMALAELRILTIHRFFPESFDPKVSQTITTAFVVVLALGGLAYAQQIPARNAASIDHAYTDTDGYGQRADRYPPDATQFYAEVAEAIVGENSTTPPRDIVVLTDERNFMSYYPFRGFQGFTSHYANPLGEFETRNQVIEDWASQSWREANTPELFIDKLAEARWKTPEAFLFRANMSEAKQAMAKGEEPAGWTYDVAEDIYPNNPNVRFKGVQFNPAVFLGAGSPWRVSQIGPYVVVTKN